MPVTFEGVSEYRRNFVVPQSVSDHTHSPIGTRSFSSGREAQEPEPHPQQDHVIIAGLSSAKLAVTQEPAFSRKRKPLENEKKVTFTTDYAEHGSPTKKDDKAMKFRAGFRRVDVPKSTEYSLQYTWKDSVPEQTPIIQAEQLLNSGHLNYLRPCNHRHNEQHTVGGRSDGNTKDGEGVSNGENFEHRKPQVVSRQNGVKSKHSDVIDGSCDSEPHPRGRDMRHESHTRSPPKVGGSRHAHGSSSKVSKKKHKSHHSHHHQSGSKKHKSGRGHRFVSEYKREFKVWPIPSSSSGGVSVTSGKDGKNEGDGQVAGSPQLLKDSSDPRLLKHKPLPTHMPIARWGSEYSANFMTPKDFDYDGGVWKGAPHPDLFMKKIEGKSKEPSGGEAVDQTPTKPWFDQLIELRQRAEEYKSRAQGVQFPPYHLSRRLRDIDDNSSVTTTTTSSSVTSHSDEPSESGLSTPSIPSAQSPTEGDRRRVCYNREKRQSVQQRQQQERMKTRLFNKAPSPTSKVRKVDLVGKGDSGDHREVEVEDIEENWDSQTISEEGTSSNTPQTGLSPQVLIQQKTRADLGTFREPEVARSRSIPRPNAVRERDGDIEGRVPTPELRKSNFEQQSRHHLDITTPAGGGILISPAKPVVGGDGGVAKSVELPFPPTSPKYRRDMKSKAPIFPSPKQHQVGNGRQSSEAAHHSLSISKNLAPQIIPSSSSPYHAHCVPHPSHIPRSSHTHNLHPSHSSHFHPHKISTTHSTSAKPSSFSGPVRKLLFDSHNKHPSQHTTHPAQHSSSTQNRLHKSHSSVVRSCDTCGAHLRSSHIPGGGIGGLGAGQPCGICSSPPTDLSRLHQQQQQNGGIRSDTLQASWQQSQHRLEQIRSQLASQSSNLHHRSSSPYADQYQPDSGLGSSNREARRGGLRSEVLGQSDVGRVGSGRDVDELSLSSLSLSSCSVASDVLNKARERRDRFWTQPSHITAS